MAKHKTRVTLSQPEDLLAALPSMLGYRPAESLVLVAFAPETKRLGKCIRVDLPPADVQPALLRQLGAAMALDPLPAAMAVVVGGGTPEAGDRAPLTDLIDELRRELARHDIALLEAYWVAEMSAGAQWRSYTNRSRHGKLPDPACSELAAELTAMGHVTFGSRAELEQLFQPDADLIVEQREDLIEEKFDELTDGMIEWSTERGAAAVGGALRAARTGLLALSDEQIAELALALKDPVIRDACMATAVPPESPLAASGALLWQSLTRALPPPERAEAACLAGYAAYQQGDGALAGIALRVALEADPDHVIAGLLHQALNHGLHPERLRALAEHDQIGLCAQLRAAA